MKMQITPDQVLALSDAAKIELTRQSPPGSYVGLLTDIDPSGKAASFMPLLSLEQMLKRIAFYGKVLLMSQRDGGWEAWIDTHSAESYEMIDALWNLYAHFLEEGVSKP